MFTAGLERLIQKYDMTLFSIKEKVFFLRELAYLLEGGVAITDAILVIKESSDKVALHVICDEIYSALNRGETLSTAMRLLPQYFNEGDANIIYSGEWSGDLTQVLHHLAQEYEFLHTVKTKYTSALIYPTFLFLVAVVAIYLLFTNVLPGIFVMVEQFDISDVPQTTQILIAITAYLQDHGLRLLLALGLFVVMILVYVSTDSGRRAMYLLSFRLPLLGKLTQYYTLIKCLRYMKLLLYSGMNYTDVFHYLRDIMYNSAYKEPLEKVLSYIHEWKTIAGALALYPHLVPKDVVTLIRVGEETASLSTTLDNTVHMYEVEFEKILDGLSKVIEPILIVLVGGVIAITALSVFGIIGSMLDAIQVWF